MKADPQEFGFSGPRYHYRRFRIRREAAELLNKAALDLGVPQARIDAAAIEFAAAVWLRERRLGESLIACLRRQFKETK